jgi:hypothetical protein
MQNSFQNSRDSIDAPSTVSAIKRLRGDRRYICLSIMLAILLLAAANILLVSLDTTMQLERRVPQTDASTMRQGKVNNETINIGDVKESNGTPRITSLQEDSASEYATLNTSLRPGEATDRDISKDNEALPNTTSLKEEPNYTVSEFPYPKACHYWQQLDDEGRETYDVSLFYNVGMINNWKSVVYDQLQTLEKCGLGYIASTLTISYHLPSIDSSVNELHELVLQFPFSSHLNVSYIEATSVPWEQKAIQAISHHCVSSMAKDPENEKSEIPNNRRFVYYFHNKGVSYYTDDWKDKYNQSRSYNNVLHWRKYVEWFLLENPSLCIDKLLNSSAFTCGVDLLNEPSWHYSGNFWASSCQWIETLPTTLGSDYFSTKMWIGSGIQELDFEKHITLFQSKNIIDCLYDTAISPEMYVQNWIKGGNSTSSADLNYAIQEDPIDPGNMPNVSNWNNVEMVEHLFNSDTIDFIDVNNLSPLFNHDVHPPYVREGILKKIRKVSLVISHCDYPLDWIERFTAGFENIIDKVWVFTKCNQNVTGALPGSQIIPLPNVGRCDHSYAYWLNHFFTEMDEKDASDQIVVFMKDADYMLPYWGDRNFGDMLSLAVSNDLGCMKMSKIASVLHWYEMVRLMRWYGHGYVRGGERGGDEIVAPFNSVEFDNVGEWVDKLQLGPIFNTKSIVSICHGGFFAATHARIAKQPKRVWEAMEKSLSRGDNIVEGHFAERIWGCLLSKPISNETAVAIVGKNFNTEYGDFSLRGMIYQQEI